MRTVVYFLLLLVFAACGSSSGEDDAATSGDVTSPEVTDLGSTEDQLPATDTSSDLAATDLESVDLEPETEADAAPPPCLDEIPQLSLSAEADLTFDLGPYVMNATPESMVIMWRTLEPCQGTVIFGTDDLALDLSVTDSGELVMHELLLDQLEADTRYAYQVKCGTKTSKVHHFVTAPNPGQPFRFVGWGDNQSGPEIFTGLVEQMVEYGPHMAIGVGDHVSAGSQTELWKLQLFGPGRPLFHQVPFFAAMGNHEENGMDYYQLFSYPHPEDAEDPYHESYYSYTYGNAFFLVINTNGIFVPVGDVDTPVSAWIKEQVSSPAAMAATWRFAYAHEPGHTENWSPGSCNFDGNISIGAFVVPLLEEHDFHIYFAGHTHAYERSLQNGLVQIITGGGGGHLDEKCFELPQTTVNHQEHHYVRLEAGCETLRLEAVDQFGTLFDWFELSVDQPGVFTEEGPLEDLPEPIINTAATDL